MGFGSIPCADCGHDEDDHDELLGCIRGMEDTGADSVTCICSRFVKRESSSSIGGAQTSQKPTEEFRPGLYNHYKGGRYRALHLVRHHDVGELFVVYVSMETGSIRIREYATKGADSWTDWVTHQGETVRRFRWIEP